MTPEQWNVSGSLLDEALKLPPEQRTAFVEKVCANDPTLRNELLGLVRQSDSTGTMFRPLPQFGPRNHQHVSRLANWFLTASASCGSSAAAEWEKFTS